MTTSETIALSHDEVIWQVARKCAAEGVIYSSDPVSLKDDARRYCRQSDPIPAVAETIAHMYDGKDLGVAFGAMSEILVKTTELMSLGENDAALVFRADKQGILCSIDVFLDDKKRDSDENNLWEPASFAGMFAFFASSRDPDILAALSNMMVAYDVYRETLQYGGANAQVN